jgi:hypothetical protein
MVTLPQKEQDKIRKLSDMRIVALLIQAGVDPDEMESMDRPKIIDARAKIVAVGGDKSSAAVGGGTSKAGQVGIGYDTTVEREQIAFERDKFQYEKSEREGKLEIEKAEREIEESERERKFEIEKAERERLAILETERIEKEAAERQARYVIEDGFKINNLRL